MLIISAAICGVLSIFVDIGMATYTEMRYGLPTYFFIFGNAGRLGTGLDGSGGRQAGGRTWNLQHRDPDERIQWYAYELYLPGVPP